MSALSNLLARKQELLQRLQDDSVAHESDVVERELKQIGVTLELLEGLPASSRPAGRAPGVEHRLDRDHDQAVLPGPARLPELGPHARAPEHGRPEPVAMENFSLGLRRALRQAQLYGYLVARNGRLFHPGGSHPVCSLQAGRETVRSGWMRIRDGGLYEITPKGLRAVDEYTV
jgi:hypothetical protein